MELPYWGRGALAGGLLLVTVFEVLAPCCLFPRRFRRLFLLVMGPTHVLIALSMNILFWENLAMFLLLLDFNPAVRSLQARIDRWRAA